MPFQRLLKPPQSTAARSMPTPRQSPLQRLQRGNLPLRKSSPYARPHTEYQNSTRSPGISAICFLYPLFNKRCKQCRSRGCQSHHNQRQPIPCQHHSNHRCCNRRGKISRCIKSSLHARAPVRFEWVLLCLMFLYPLFNKRYKQCRS